MSDTESDYEWTDPDAVELACDHCDRVKPCLRRVDPFLSEVYGERSRVTWWCYGCFSDRKDQV